jgi:glycosyltransferase involved in cell wall biosynthesis
MKRENGAAPRVLVLMEATTITGPAKNLFEFIRRARVPNASFPLGIDFRLVTFLRGSGSNGFIEGARSAGIETDVIAEQRAFQFSIARDLREIVKVFDPHIIQTHNIKSHFLIRLLALRKKRSWIAFHHGYIASDLKVKSYNQLDRWSLRAADRLVAVCGPFADQLAAAGLKREKVLIRHNMIQPYTRPAERDIQGLRDRLRIGLADQVVISVGRLSREKGHLDLVNAMGILQAQNGLSNVRVLVVGEGPDRALLERRIEELKLKGIVQLVGHHADPRAFYALADLLVLPSHSEGSPNVLLEALAAGIPIVATAVGGVPEIVTDHVNALLVPQGDLNRLAAGIASLLRDSNLRLRLSQQGLAALERFTPEAYCESILNLYRESLYQ